MWSHMKCPPSEVTCRQSVKYDERKYEIWNPMISYEWGPSGESIGDYVMAVVKGKKM